MLGADTPDPGRACRAATCAPSFGLSIGRGDNQDDRRKVRKPGGEGKLRRSRSRARPGSGGGSARTRSMGPRRDALARSAPLVLGGESGSQLLRERARVGARPRSFTVGHERSRCTRGARVTSKP